jgi:hypothetical protein
VAGVVRPTYSGRTGGEARTAAGPATKPRPHEVAPSPAVAGPTRPSGSLHSVASPIPTSTARSTDARLGRVQEGRESSLRDLFVLLDWIREEAQRRPMDPNDDSMQTAALSLLDGAVAMLRIHRPGTFPDGSLYCAVCLGESGSRAWPCQTVRAFGLAALGHWLPRLPSWLTS